ncbi:glycosyltransferase family protein [Microvirga mediterraneensis]|uniref:Glycosyltransferase n=1 Tax=Microvirga mediterraneensis TaxID=2754695 RepID=A0A838BRY9_9HYPH|nr:glycosyltransferase [Microvirga mediterraneensis]MBA1158168.1 glycosyltransferase [Microvirga mediterraneensis]
MIESSPNGTFPFGTKLHRAIASGQWTQCISPASFWSVSHLIESAWLEHAPFALWLIDALRPSVLVELNSQDGFSYLTFCQAVRDLDYAATCYAVGARKSDQGSGLTREDAFARLMTLNQESYANFSHVLDVTSDTPLPHIADGSIDLLHIDGCHSYEQIKAKFQNWQPKLSARGVVLFHNINARGDNSGVWRFWSELRPQFPSFAFVHGRGLGVLAAGSDVPATLQALFSARDGDIDIIRASYAQLGGALRKQFELGESKSRLVDAVAEQRRLRRNLDEQRHRYEAEIAAQEKALQQLSSLIARVPKSLRMIVRRSAKAAWWLLTPHRMPARVALMRARMNAGTSVPRTETRRTSKDSKPPLRPAKDRVQGAHPADEREATEIRPSKPTQVRLGVLTAAVRDFTLSISGWVIHEQYPGLPIELAIELKGAPLPLKTFFASTPSGDIAWGLPDSALYFTISHDIPESLIGKDFQIRAVKDGVVFEDLLINWGSGRSTRRDETTSSSMEEEVGTTDLIAGQVETAKPSRISGWALNRSNPWSAPAELILTVDDEPYARTKAVSLREDVRKVEGGNGFVGFEFPLAPNVLAGGSITAKVEPSMGRPSILQNIREIHLPGYHLGAKRDPEAHLFEVCSRIPRGQKISVIVLNRNGAGVLEGLLESAWKTGDLGRFEWIVVDHQSTDTSAEVCAKARSSGAAIHFFDRHGNFSFSESNNFGAQRATGDILVFANNDLILRDSIYERILDTLEDDRVGIVGAKLLDYVDAPGWEARGPVQHLGVFMKPGIEQEYLRPYESRRTRETPVLPDARQSRPAVTAAFIAMRRSDFDAVGGFDEAYSYGLEDVDISFKVKRQLKKEVICDQGLEIIHRHGYSRSKDASAALRRRNNNHHFNRQWAQWLRRNIRHDVLTKPGFWIGARPTIGFIVSDTSSSDDYLAAFELGRALQTMAPVHLRYLNHRDWYSLGGIDILIVMASEFDLAKVKVISPYVTTVNWVQHWHQHWNEAPPVDMYDHVWTGSRRAADDLQTRTGRAVAVLPMASNTKLSSRGRAQAEFTCDYCFIGSNSGRPRTIQFDLDPSSINGRGLVFGANWERTPIAPISRGPLDYKRYPDVYASAKVVIDDMQAFESGLSICRNGMFDALGAGCLVITNRVEGVHELFGDRVPTYRDRKSLTETLNYWLSHEEERNQRVAELRRVVEEQHTYEHRAQKVMELLTAPSFSPRVAIKCPAPSIDGKDWGDYHFAQSLAGALRRIGCVVRVDMREDWECALSEIDDVSIMLRGLKGLKPKPHQKNILWLISHPEAVSTQELNRYDQIYVASAAHAEILRKQCKVPVEHMPQCTDITRFKFEPALVNNPKDRVVFVGNSRGTFRDSVRWAVEHGLDIDIYGSDWEPFITDNRLKGRKVPNSVLGEFYASSRLVLCDHWEDMRRLGYVSNRVFDVLAAGGALAVDPVEGLSDLLPKGSYQVFRNGEELASLTRNTDPVDLERRAEIASYVAAHHSFDARAATIMRKLQEWNL